MGSVEEAVQAIRAGKLVVLPTDTVYGLVGGASSAGPASRLALAKGRDELQPIALLAADLDVLLKWIPELHGRSASIARTLLPGRYTLVFPNPALRFPWLAGARADTIGVRVPAFEGPGREALERLGAFAATSANLAGGGDPHSLADVSEPIRAAAAVLLDGGELPGAASTVLDFTGPAPRVLREGAAPASEALRAVASVL